MHHVRTSKLPLAQEVQHLRGATPFVQGDTARQGTHGVKERIRQFEAAIQQRSCSGAQGYQPQGCSSKPRMVLRKMWPAPSQLVTYKMPQVQPPQSGTTPAITSGSQSHSRRCSITKFLFIFAIFIGFSFFTLAKGCIAGEEESTPRSLEKGWDQHRRAGCRYGDRRHSFAHRARLSQGGSITECLRYPFGHRSRCAQFEGYQK